MERIDRKRIKEREACAHILTQHYSLNISRNKPSGEKNMQICEISEDIFIQAQK